MHRTKPPIIPPIMQFNARTPILPPIPKFLGIISPIKTPGKSTLHTIRFINMIFAILRDNKPFEIISPQEHIKQYNSDSKCGLAA